MTISAKNLLANSLEARSLTETAQFLQMTVDHGWALEYLSMNNLEQFFNLISPWFKLDPCPNPDLAYEWSNSIAEDQRFRWDGPWKERKFNHKWDVRVFSSPLLIQIPIVLAEIVKESEFAGRQINLQWHVISPQMLSFSSFHQKPENDWYNHPEKVLQKNWISFTDNDDLLKSMSNDEDID